MDDTIGAAMVSYLIDVLLLQKDAIFPSSERSAEKSMLMQWSNVGKAMRPQHPSDEYPAQPVF